MEKLRIGSFFSGIGAFEKALERLGIPHEVVFYCEIDKYASEAYSLIHEIPESFNLWDITKVDETKLPDFDLMTWGFPCQDISVAGKQAGIIKGETRSGLYYDGLRILRHKKPKYSIIENVKNLVGKKFEAEFNQMLCDLEDAGYRSYWQVLNAKDYGIPQNRERVFIISIRKDVDNGYSFPLPFDNGLRLKDLLEDEVDEKYFVSQEKTEQLLKSIGMPDDMFIRHTQDGFHMARKDSKQSSIQGTHVTYPDGNSHCMGSSHVPMTVIPVLTPDRQEKQQNGRRFKEPNEPMFTLTGQDRHGILINRDNLVIPNDEMCRCIPASYYHGLDNHGARTGVLQYIGGIGEGKWLDDGNELSRNYPQGQRVYGIDGLAVCQNANGGGLGAKTGLYLHNYRIRKLTPLECFRLMGFDDKDFWICKDNGISDSQLYKMTGNSIVVQVLEGILSNLLRPGVMLGSFYGEQLALFG